MSAIQISRSLDLMRLQDEGYAIQIVEGIGVHLLIHNIPYVNRDCQISRGTLVSPIIDLTSDGITRGPLQNHQTWWIGEQPCTREGVPMESIVCEKLTRELGDGITTHFGFSQKPLNNVPYANYYAKMTRYIDIISNQAIALDSTLTYRTSQLTQLVGGDSVFRYADTSSSRCGIGKASENLTATKIAIIGLGGTGSYILDLIAKTHVREIHLFDRDQFKQSNAFRAPGAATPETLKTQPFKVDYFVDIYSNMRNGIIAHKEHVTVDNINSLAGFDFAFICVDDPQASQVIINGLLQLGVPFIVVGIDVRTTPNGELTGQVSTTLASNQMNKHLPLFVSTATGQVNHMYESEIQIADLNALNAVLAVIRWKKFCGFYRDEINDINSTYVIDTHALTKNKSI